MRLETLKQWARRVARGFGHGYRWGRVITTVVVFALVALDAWLEIHGLPAGGVEAVQGLLANHGVKVVFREARIGVVNGLCLEDVDLLDHQHPAVIMAHADALGFRPQFTPLLAGHLRPARIAFSGLEVHPPPLDGRTMDPQQGLPPLRLNGQIYFRRHHMVEFAPLSGDLSGVRFQVTGRLTGVPYDRWFSGGGQGDFRCGWDSLLATCGPETQKRVLGYLESYNRSGLPRADGEIEARLDIPWDTPRNGSLWGSFSFADLPVRYAMVRKLRGQFALSDQRLRFRHVLLQLAGDQAAEAEAELDLAKLRISGSASGILNPVVLFQLAGRSAPGILTEVRWGKPLRVEASLQPSPLELAKLRGTVKFFCEGLFFRTVAVQAAEGRIRFADAETRLEELRVSGIQCNALRLHRVTAAATYAGGVLTVNPVTVTVAEDGREQATGAVTFYPQAGEFTAELTGSLRPLRLAESWGGLPPLLTGIANDFRFDGAPPTLRCRIERSPFAPARWRGQASLEVNQFAFRDLAIAQAAATVALEPGRLSLSATAASSGAQPQSATVAATIQTATNRIAGRVQASLYPDRLARQLRLFTENTLPPLHFDGPPVTLTAILNDSPVNPVQWHGSGQVTAENGTYDTLTIRQLQSDLAFDPAKIVFTKLAAVTASGDRLNGDVTVTLPNGDLCLQGQVIGDPLFALAFVTPGKYRDRYRRIWRDVTWDKAHPPVFRIDRLTYINSQIGSSWSLGIDLHGDVQNPVYRDFHAQTLAVDLHLCLPDSIRLEKIHVTADHLVADANVGIELTDLASCRLQVKATGDPRRILRVIEPEWDDFFKDIRFGNTTQVDCQGGFFIGQEARPRLTGRLTSPDCGWRNYAFANFDARWLLEDTRLAWAPATGKFYEGDVVASGSYDFDLDAGHLNLTLTRMRLATFLAGISTPGQAADKSKPKNQVDGFISANGALELLRPFNSKVLQINGASKLWVREGDLWNLPVLASLGKIIGASSLGKITSAEADLVFAGEQVFVPSFTTDGTPIALRGNGEFSRTTDAISFRVRGEALKKTAVLPLLLNPFFWFFEAELNGTFKEHRWRLTRHLGDMFAP